MDTNKLKQEYVSRMVDFVQLLNGDKRVSKEDVSVLFNPDVMNMSVGYLAAWMTIKEIETVINLYKTNNLDFSADLDSEIKRRGE